METINVNNRVVSKASKVTTETRRKQMFLINEKNKRSGSKVTLARKEQMKIINQKTYSNSKNRKPVFEKSNRIYRNLSNCFGSVKIYRNLWTLGYLQYYIIYLYIIVV